MAFSQRGQSPAAENRRAFLLARREAEPNCYRLVTLCQSCRFWQPGLGQTYYDGFDPDECAHPLEVVREYCFDRANDGSLRPVDNIGGDCWAFRPFRPRFLAVDPSTQPDYSVTERSR